MSGRCDDGWGRWIVIAVLLLFPAWMGAGCGAWGSTSEGSGAVRPGSTATAASPAALATPTAVATDRPNMPAAEIVDVLEGRIAAMNRGDGAAAAGFYTEDGVLEETDLTPHLISLGRAELTARFNELYSLGLRLAPAGAPIAYDRYVAEPTRFHHVPEPGRGAGMLIFEVGPGNKLAHQWMIGWAGGPEETFAIDASPSVDRPNLPPPRIMKVLKGYTTAFNSGDGSTAASYFARRGRAEELDRYPNVVSKGRGAIAARLEELHAMGLRLEAAGSPITYDAYVAQPVRFFNSDSSRHGHGMLVFQFDPAYRIIRSWVVGEQNRAAE